MAKLNASQKFLKDHDIVSRISFKDGKPHTVRILSDEADTIVVEGKETEGIRYTVEENGEKKEFFTGSPYLIQQIAENSLVEELIIQMKKRKRNDGSFVSYFDVQIVGGKEMNEDIEPDELPPDLGDDFASSN